MIHMWSDEKDEIMKLFEDTDEHFPRMCPCCGKQTGHVFFYKHHDKRFGSAWAWCSECQEFSHSRFLVPDWWKNMNTIKSDELHGRPDDLDKECEAIDDWVNMLLSQRSKRDFESV